MIRHDTTVQALAAISDPGLFETLCTAVLRAANPERYSNLTHPGVNQEGKTVKAPVDGLAFVSGADPRHMVAVHHTTCKESGLLRKWLHDPSTEKPRKGGRKPSTPAGDILKTSSIAAAERRDCPSLKVTLALTTNREPPEDVTREMERVAHTHGIVIDLWARSRIAQFLDHTPVGQRLRKLHLGIEQDLLSRDLLHELSRKSIEVHRPRVSANEDVDRLEARTIIESTPGPVGFLIGASGFGKSVACHRYLSSHVNRGGVGLVLPHEVLAVTLTLDQALDAAFRQLHPALSQDSGAAARLLCSADSPLLIVVEDICRSGQSAHLIERLSRWAHRQTQSRDVPHDNWRLICPVWPELLASLSDETRKQVEALGRRLGAFSPQDAREAILRRAGQSGEPMSALDADRIAVKLGYDPLLIGLSDFKQVVLPQQVLASFISGSMERLAATAGTQTASDYARVLRALAHQMLTTRTMEPTWSDVLSWFGAKPEHIATLRELVKHGEIVRLAQPSGGARLNFRHDRVRRWLLIHAFASAMQASDPDSATLAEPFFADIVGEAMSEPQTPSRIADLAQQLNPLALFYALNAFGEPAAPVHQAVLSAIDAWLDDERSHGRANQSLRFNALHVLSDTQSSQIARLLGRFRDRTWSALVAGLRNGDLGSGVELCRSLKPGMGVGWRDRAIEHATMQFGAPLEAGLSEMLKRSDLTSGEISGALRFAGHMGRASLAEAVRSHWDADTGRAHRLDDYLWAVTQCWGTGSAELLALVCDAWASLPDTSEEKGHPSPRDNLAADHIAWAFWKRLPEPALAFFIKRAEGEDLRWQITYMLRGVDHPSAVGFIAEEQATLSRALEGNGGISTFTPYDHWERRQRETDRPMSEASRSRLFEIWTAPQHDKYTRKSAFHLWAATSLPEDLPILRQFQDTDVLADDILRVRLRRMDELAVPLLVDRISDDERAYRWLQNARGITSDAMIAVIDDQLSRRGEALVSPTWGDRGDQDWTISDLVIRLDASIAEKLLLKHWHHVRYSPRYVQAALYAATPRLLALVAQAVKDCPSPDSLFAHIDSQFGIKYLGHPGVTRIEQLEALVPYFGHVGDFSLHSFWDLCTDRGWIAFRRRNLDALLSGKWREHAGLDDTAVDDELNRQLEREGTAWLDHWIGRLIDSGRSAQNILAILGKWLTSNRSPKALEIAASIVVSIGTRSDPDLLKDAADQSAFALDILNDTRFAVCRRSLM